MRPEHVSERRRGRFGTGAAAVMLAVVLGMAGLVGVASAIASPEPTDPPAGQEPGEGGQQDVDDESTLTWSVRPTPTDEEPERPNFSVEVAPGDTVEDSIRVRNYQSEPLSLQIYASDALTTSSGALDLLPAEEEPVDVGAWVELAEPAIKVPGQGYVDVPFTLTVPDDAEPGDHVGGIVTSYTSEAADDSGEPVVVDRRLGNRVQVRVDGPLRPELTVSGLGTSYDGSWNPFAGGGLHVAYTVTNTGNVRLGAEQLVATEGPFGVLAHEQSLEAMPELLPGSSLDFAATVSDVWPTFRTATAVRFELMSTREGDEFNTSVATASATTWTIPWPQLVLLIVLVGAALAALWSRRRRRRREDARVQEAVAAALADRDAGERHDAR